MTGEIIEVCQDCGHIIDPVRVKHDGKIYEIRLCMRDECIGERLSRAVFGDLQEELEERWRAHRVALLHRFGSTVIDPHSMFRITGLS